MCFAYQKLNVLWYLTLSQTTVLVVTAEQGVCSFSRRELAGYPYCRTSCRYGYSLSQIWCVVPTKLRAMSRAVGKFGGGCALPIRSLKRFANTGFNPLILHIVSKQRASLVATMLIRHSPTGHRRSCHALAYMRARRMVKRTKEANTTLANYHTR